MKAYKKIALEKETLDKLRQKANSCGFRGRTWLSDWLGYIADTGIIYNDQNAQNLTDLFSQIIKK